MCDLLRTAYQVQADRMTGIGMTEVKQRQARQERAAKPAQGSASDLAHPQLQLGTQGLKTPLYHQIYLILKGRITDGVYGPDARLPSEQDLTERFGVSRITAKRAMDELAAEGLVVRERARGTRVIYQPPSGPIPSSVEGLLENLIAMGLETTAQLLEFEYLSASGAIAQALELDSRQRSPTGRTRALHRRRALFASDHLCPRQDRTAIRSR